MEWSGCAKTKLSLSKIFSPKNPFESPKENDEPILCDTISSTCRQFNGKLKCYGFDVPIDDAQRRFADLAFQVNFIAKNIPKLFNTATTKIMARKKLIEFADHLRQEKSLDSDLKFNPRNGKYLKKLAKKMKGLPFSEMKKFPIKENNRLANKADHYEELSRKGPTNNLLKREILSHQKQLQGSKQRLFIIAGARHLNPAVNTHLKDVLSGEHPVSLLKPKKSYSI